MNITKMARQFIDIGANLTDSMYSGIYNGGTKHKGDLINVLKRSWDAGLDKIIITAGNCIESKTALELANTDARLYSTVGCHPTRCNEFEITKKGPDNYLNELKELAINGGKKIVAIGECGLDYDRLQFCTKEVQKKYFEKQLVLSQELNLPLFLHCRNAAQDLIEILNRYSELNGVVHSFDGTSEEADLFVKMGYYIGLNGCSLKTTQNLEMVKSLPKDKILIETDCPWCEIRPSHAGYEFIEKGNISPSVKKEKWTEDLMVKGRNEPANIRQVMDVLATVRNEDATQLCKTIYENTIRLFFSDK